MLSNPACSLFAFSALLHLGAAAHGDGAEGTVMGPVAFLWPSDRPWGAAQDNIGPCGSASGPSNRTNFPLGSIGSIELTIADDAENLAIRIAYGNNSATQDVFQSVKSNVTEVEPGHQCYSLPAPPSSVTAGSNATIQLEYWADDSSKNESFFACADITYVEAVTFTDKLVCFNVTASEFETPSSTASSTPIGTTVQTTSSPSATSKGGNGLSGGAKAGIAVGSIVGAALVFAVLFLAIRRKRGTKDTEAAVQPMEKTRAASIGSAETAH